MVTTSIKMKILLMLLCTSSLVACVTSSLNTNGEIFGKYIVVNRNCTGNSFMQDQCKDIKLLEFVKGNFYKISNEEVAFVIWSGSTNEDLMYSARKYMGETVTIVDRKLFAHIEKSKDVNEYVEFSSNEHGQYFLESRSSNGNLAYSMILDIERIKPESGTRFITNYPGND